VIFSDGKEVIVADAVGILGIVLVVCKMLSFSIKFIQSSASRPNPERAGMIDANRADSIIAETMRIFGVMDKVGKLSGVAVKPI
jgi:hypothetical protein